MLPPVGIINGHRTVVHPEGEVVLIRRVSFTGLEPEGSHIAGAGDVPAHSGPGVEDREMRKTVRQESRAPQRRPLLRR